ncbi:hypothetical protein J437_LFUL011138 [Ladona fulva]|uniref:Uncharacterized protein n=1 Tax=Ladona fulva TaxID=123851 RepID=A0A8K0K6K1_LADFU|nr:hypothetical protein J437_LFUL011138 [Ladona fulva]
MDTTGLASPDYRIEKMMSSFGLAFSICIVYSLFGSVINHRPVVIVVSFDGFRHDFVKDLTLTKFHSLMKEGSHSDYMINVFCTKTFPNHQSIATGLYPESHGVIDNSLYDPKYGRRLNFSAELYEYDDVIPIWILNEVAGNGSYSGVMMWPGGEFPYGNSSVDYVSLKNKKVMPTFSQKWDISVPWETRVDIVMSWITHPETPTNLVMLYFEEPDSTSHIYGPESEIVKKKLHDLDSILSYLCQKIESMKLKDIVNVILVSDHGMKTVTPSEIIDLSAGVNTSMYTVPSTSPVLHIYPNEGYEDEVYKQLSTMATKNSFKVYKKNDLPERWHIKNSRRTPPILAVADEGYIFEDFYKTMDYYRKQYNITPSRNQTYGVHGYDNAVESMHPIFLAWGPLIRKGYKIDPFNSVDIFPLVSKILNLPHHRVNGTLYNIVNILKVDDPSSSGFSSIALIGGIAALAAVIIGGAGIVTSSLLSKRKSSNGYDRQLEQNQCQSILKEMGIEEQRLLSDSEED